MNYPERSYAPATFEPDTVLTVKKLRQDAKDMRDQLAPHYPEPLRGHVHDVANLLLNVIDYFEARHGQP